MKNDIFEKGIGTKFILTSPQSRIPGQKKTKMCELWTE
jgi:hypothetical protein